MPGSRINLSVAAFRDDFALVGISQDKHGARQTEITQNETNSNLRSAPSGLAIEGGKVTLYSRNGKIVSHSYMEVAKALEGVEGDAVIDGELVAVGKDGVSHFQLLQNALRYEAKLQYCAFDLMFQDEEDLRRLPLTERKKRLKAIVPKHKLIAFSRDRRTFGTRFFEEAKRKGLEGIMAKRADSKYLSGARTDDWLKIKTSRRQEVVIAGFTAPRRTRSFFRGTHACVARREWLALHRPCRHGLSHETLKELHKKLIKLETVEIALR